MAKQSYNRYCLPIALIATVLMLGILSYLYFIRYESLLIAGVGQQDYVAFWGAYHAAINEQNPYAVDDILRWQRTALPGLNQPQMYLSPPWTLSLLSPILWMGFLSSSHVFFVCNLIAVVIVCFSILTPDERKRWSLLSGLLCFPAVVCVLLGQLSLLVLLATALALNSLRENRPLLASLYSIFLTIKPQLVLVFGIYLMVEAIRGGNKSYLVYCLSNFLLLAVITVFLFPNIYWQWLNSEFSPVFHETCSPIRALLQAVGGLSPVQEIFIVFMLAMLVGIKFGYGQTGQTFNALQSARAIMLSLMFAPYVMFYDYSLLILSSLTLLKSVYDHQRRTLICFFLTINSGVALLYLLSPLLSRDWWYILFFGIVHIYAESLATGQSRQIS